MYNSNCDNTNGGFFVSPKGPQNILTTNQVVFKAPVLGYPPRVVADRGPQVREFCVMTAKNGLPCNKCGGNEWHSDGKHCAICDRARMAQWQKENPEKAKERNAKYRERHRDRERERHRVYQLNNPEKGKANNRRYRERNLEEQRERERQYAQNNPDIVNAKNQRRRAKVRGNGGSYTAEEWRTICNHYGNKCLRCGRDDVKLTPDHILPVSKGGGSDICNIQPLCLSCNSKKHNKHIDYRPDAGVFRWIQAKLFG